MCKAMMKGLLYENGQLSLTRVLAVSSFLLFAAGTGYLMLTGQSWQHYETFAGLTAGGGLLTQVANKAVNSKLNSDIGQFPNK